MQFCSSCWEVLLRNNWSISGKISETSLEERFEWILSNFRCNTWRNFHKNFLRVFKRNFDMNIWSYTWRNQPGENPNTISERVSEKIWFCQGKRKRNLWIFVKKWHLLNFAGIVGKIVKEFRDGFLKKFHNDNAIWLRAISNAMYGVHFCEKM